MSAAGSQRMINRILAEVAEVTEYEALKLNLSEYEDIGGKDVPKVKVRWTQ